MKRLEISALTAYLCERSNILFTRVVWCRRVAKGVVWDSWLPPFRPRSLQNRLKIFRILQILKYLMLFLVWMLQIVERDHFGISSWRIFLNFEETSQFFLVSEYPLLSRLPPWKFCSYAPGLVSIILRANAPKVVLSSIRSVGYEKLQVFENLKIWEHQKYV